MIPKLLLVHYNALQFYHKITQKNKADLLSFVFEFWFVRLAQLPIKLVAIGAIGKHGWHEFGGADGGGALELNGGGGSESKIPSNWLEILNDEYFNYM